MIEYRIVVRQPRRTHWVVVRLATAVSAAVSLFSHWRHGVG